MIQDALDKISRGEVIEAERLLADAPEDRLVRAYCLLCRGRPAQAAPILSDSTVVGNELGRLLTRAMDLFNESKAIDSLPLPASAARQSPEREDEVYDELRDVDQEHLLAHRDDLETQARAGKCDSVTLFQLGDTLAFRLGDAAGGRVFLEYAVRADPSRALYWGFLGELIYKNFSIFESIEYYNRAVDLDADNPRWHLYRSMVLPLVMVSSLSDPSIVPIDTRQESIAEARTAVEKAVALGERFEILGACRSNLESFRGRPAVGEPLSSILNQPLDRATGAIDE
jgi:hypothetical protein